MDSGQCRATFASHSADVNDLAITPDGAIAISGSSDSTLKVWDLATSQCLATLKGHDSHVFRVAVTPDGKMIVSGSGDGTLRVWDLDLAIQLGQDAEPGAHYVNAKVVLVGDTSVGKTGLSLVLNNQPFGDPGSTAGRHVWTFDSQEKHSNERL